MKFMILELKRSFAAAVVKFKLKLGKNIVNRKAEQNCHDSIQVFILVRRFHKHMQFHSELSLEIVYELNLLIFEL